MHDSYNDWLRRAVPAERTKGSRLSELRRIEAAYGDIDNLYEQDELQSLIDELSYTSEDARQNKPNPSKLQIDGDLRTCLATYKSALQKYVLFRRNVEIEATRIELTEEIRSVDDALSERERTFSMERDLQSALRNEIEQLEHGLFIVDGGAEKTVRSGRIDILAKDPSGAWVVIELKSVRAQRNDVGQLLAYMGDLMEETSEPVRGILIAPDFDPKALSAARAVTSLKLANYAFRFTFSAVGARIDC